MNYTPPVLLTSEQYQQTFTLPVGPDGKSMDLVELPKKIALATVDLNALCNDRIFQRYYYSQNPETPIPVGESAMTEKELFFVQQAISRTVEYYFQTGHIFADVNASNISSSFQGKVDGFKNIRDRKDIIELLQLANCFSAFTVSAGLKSIPVYSSIPFNDTQLTYLDTNYFNVYGNKPMQGNIDVQTHNLLNVVSIQGINNPSQSGYIRYFTIDQCVFSQQMQDYINGFVTQPPASNLLQTNNTWVGTNTYTNSTLFNSTTTFQTGGVAFQDGLQINSGNVKLFLNNNTQENPYYLTISNLSDSIIFDSLKQVSFTLSNSSITLQEANNLNFMGPTPTVIYDTNKTFTFEEVYNAIHSGGGGTNLLPLNNTWTGTNNFQQAVTLNDPLVFANTTPTIFGSNFEVSTLTKKLVFDFTGTTNSISFQDVNIMTSQTTNANWTLNGSTGASIDVNAIVETVNQIPNLQPLLTAGSNITINGNIISATTSSVPDDILLLNNLWQGTNTFQNTANVDAGMQFGPNSMLMFGVPFGNTGENATFFFSNPTNGNPKSFNLMSTENINFFPNQTIQNQPPTIYSLGLKYFEETVVLYQNNETTGTQNTIGDLALLSAEGKVNVSQLVSVVNELPNLQPKLTAGTGITIENNVISSTSSGNILDDNNTWTGINTFQNDISLTSSSRLTMGNPLLGTPNASLFFEPGNQTYNLWSSENILIAPQTTTIPTPTTVNSLIIGKINNEIFLGQQDTPYGSNSTVGNLSFVGPTGKVTVEQLVELLSAKEQNMILNKNILSPASTGLVQFTFTANDFINPFNNSSNLPVSITNNAMELSKLGKYILFFDFYANNANTDKQIGKMQVHVISTDPQLNYRIVSNASNITTGNQEGSTNGAVFESASQMQEVIYILSNPNNSSLQIKIFSNSTSPGAVIQGFDLSFKPTGMFAL